MSIELSVTRREFIKITSIAGSGLVLGVSIGADPEESPQIFQPNVWIRIDTTGQITIQVARSEMGQGPRTAMPMMIAEELEADWDRIRIEPVPYDEKYGNQGTGGSTSVRKCGEPMRRAGAVARQLLITAAAQIWNVQPATCRAENSTVIHEPSGRRLGYGDLVAPASRLPVPDPNTVVLKDSKNFRLIGKSIPRLDIPEKVDGTAQFGLDVRIPGMHYAAIARCPVFGGKVESFDSTAAMKVPGVEKVVPVSRGIAVVATSTWSAFQGRDALKIQWTNGPVAKANSKTILDAYSEVIRKEGSVAKDVGNVKDVWTGSKTKLEAIYGLPYQSHAPIEPMNCVANVTNDHCEIWAPTQFPDMVHEQAVRLTGFAPTAIRVNITLLGGGFGRRIQPDYAIEAVEISKAVALPVQVVWTRSDDFHHDYYRPNSLHYFQGALDENGRPVAWFHRMVAPSIGRYMFQGDFEVYEATREASSLPYMIPNFRVEWTPSNDIAPDIPIGWWRSVYASQTAFADESFIDELAAAANKDPYEFRMSLLPENSPYRGVLQLAAEKADWGKPPALGRGRGIAAYSCFGSTCAMVAEVSLTQARVKVHRVVCAVDCGIAVHPDTIASQLEGAVAFGLTAAVKSEITFENGKTVQSSYADFDLIRMNDMPEVEVHIVPSMKPSGGIGEPGVPVIAPAVANAIYAASGKRVRRLPVQSMDLI